MKSWCFEVSSAAPSSNLEGLLDDSDDGSEDMGGDGGKMLSPGETNHDPSSVHGAMVSLRCDGMYCVSLMH